MNALRQRRNELVESRAIFGGKAVVDMPKAIISADESIVSSGSTGQLFSRAKRRVQIPLPKAFESRIEQLQARFLLPSYAAVIQTALGLLYNIVELAKDDVSLWIEGETGRRAISPFAFIGALSKNKREDDAVVRYQLMLDANQNDKLSTLISALEASSAAEVVRYALRILECIGNQIGEEECVVAITSNGTEVELDLS
jgi:hypothetical protein